MSFVSRLPRHGVSLGPLGGSTVAMLLFVGCNVGRSGQMPRGDASAERDAPPPPNPACFANDGEPDVDGDGIWDGYESLPNQDRDGDGFSDSDEARSTDPCNPANTDGDGLRDFEDPDSDNDGVTDADERAAGSNPILVDTDGDGFSDLIEISAGTSPTSAASQIPAGDFAVVLPYNGGVQPRELEFGTNLAVGDVFFLVDMTGSMQEERTNLINGLVNTIIPGVQAQIPDVWFGVGGLDDYPVGAPGEPPYGFQRSVFNPPPPTGSDVPYYMLSEMAPSSQDLGSWSISASDTACPQAPAQNDIGSLTGGPNGSPDILDAVRGLPCHYGAYSPESYIPALYATATGTGLSWPAGSGTFPWVNPPFVSMSWPAGSVAPRTCPAIPDQQARVGYPCFRDDALPIIVLIGDAQFHNGPAGANPYNSTVTGGAPGYDATVAALVGIGARVVGVFSGDTSAPNQNDRTYYQQALTHFQAIATATGTVNGSGQPLVEQIQPNGSGLDARVVTAITTLVNESPQDVTARPRHLENPTSVEVGIADTSRFIPGIVPTRCTGTCGQMDTSEAYGTFRQVVPGARVTFTVNFDNTIYNNTTGVPKIFRARIVVLGNGVAQLDQRECYIVVPPNGEEIVLR